MRRLTFEVFKQRPGANNVRVIKDSCRVFIKNLNVDYSGRQTVGDGRCNSLWGEQVDAMEFSAKAGNLEIGQVLSSSNDFFRLGQGSVDFEIGTSVDKGDANI